MYRKIDTKVVDMIQLNIYIHIEPVAVKFFDFTNRLLQIAPAISMN